MVLPFSVCRPVSTPIRRTWSRQPGNEGSSASTITSSASPSSARVPGIEPKSNGKECPAGRMRLSLSTPSSSSTLYLLRLPRGASSTKRMPSRCKRRTGLALLVLQEGGDFFPRARHADEVALHLVAAQRRQHVGLLLGLHAFGDHRELERPRERDDRLHQRHRIVVFEH